MEEDTGRTFSVPGRWRGRRPWIPLCASLVAAAAVFLLVWIIPPPEQGAGEASPARGEGELQRAPEETADGTNGDAAGGRAQDAPGRESGPQPTVAPGTGEGAPGVVVAFPDPADGGAAVPPPGGYADLAGGWVLEMSGNAYGLTNCHVTLHADGTISSPPEYDRLFEVMAGTYTWREGGPAFSASLHIALKPGPGRAAVPVRMELTGNVAGSMREIRGEFSAEPQGEVYAPYAQRGGFSMRR